MKERKHKKIKIVIITIITVILLWVIYDFTPLIKVPLANKIYGTSKCKLSNTGNNSKVELDDEDHPMVSLPAGSVWKCGLCYRVGHYPNSNTPKLCDICSRITNRCNQCAKLKE